MGRDLKPCQPPIWAKGGHAQTLLGHLLPSPSLKTKGRPIEVQLKGGDRLVTSYFPGQKDVAVYLFHGLGGSSSSGYMHRMASLYQELGYSVFLNNHRGCGEGKGLAREPYHSGRAEDLSQILELGREMYPHKKHLAIGFSLSGNALLLLLSGQRGTCLPDVAIAVNAPIHLERASLKLLEGFNRVYDLHFVYGCRQEIGARRELGLLDRLYPVPWLASLRDFDEIYTAPASGFKDRSHYYETSSAYPVLEKIKTPTVMLTAKDDPFIDYRDYLEAKPSKTVKLHLEEHGGHMGYLTSPKTPLGSHRWLDYALLHYTRHLLGLAS